MRSFLTQPAYEIFFSSHFKPVYPGLGQLYKGHFVQAIIWFLVVGAAYGLLYWFIFALVPIVLHIICILQAYFMDNE